MSDVFNQFYSLNKPQKVTIPEGFTTVDKYLFGIPKPKIEGTVVYDAQRQALIDQAKDQAANLIMQSGKPDDEQAKLQSSLLLGAIFKKPWNEIYNNFDLYSEAILGERLPPQKLLGIAKRAVEKAEITAILMINNIMIDHYIYSHMNLV